MDKLEYRMYGLVPYNLSPIQQGIQFAHALQEYNNDVLKDRELKGYSRSDFIKWAHIDKTVIILNGGTTNNSNLGHTSDFKGSLNNHWLTLLNHKVELATFSEEDLGDQLTAVVFLVDERVFNIKKYPDFVPTNGLITDVTYQPGYCEWVESIGGEKNVWLREFLKQFKLA